MNNFLGVHGLPHNFTPLMGGTNGIQPKEPQIKQQQQEAENSKVSVNYYGDHGGCGWWRLQLPELEINYSKRGNILGLTKLIPGGFVKDDVFIEDGFYSDVKSVRLQRQASVEHHAFFTHLRKVADKRNIKLIYEIDDVILKDDIPDFNVAKDAYKDPKTYDATVAIMKMCDQMTVTTDYLKQYFEDKIGHKNIKVIPNMSSRMWFDGFYNSTKIMTSFEKNYKRPRVLYAGSGNHFNLKQTKNQKDDFHHVLDVIIKTKKQFKWVFMGAYPYELKQYIDSGEMELHNWANIPDYPQKLYELNANAVIAPLVDCAFNKSKSNIKYLESAYLGIPGVFQDMVTYKEAPIKFKTGDEMIDQLKNLLTNRQIYTKMSKSARNYANTMWLNDHISEYEELYFGE